jgi:hypothetical protein
MKDREEFEYDYLGLFSEATYMVESFQNKTMDANRVLSALVPSVLVMYRVQKLLFYKLFFYSNVLCYSIFNIKMNEYYSRRYA